jgi:hypothetical protein
MPGGRSIDAATQTTMYVIATTLAGSRAALTAAIPLARGSGARLVVLVPHIVPYPIAVDGPVDSTAFASRQYRDLVRNLGGEAEVRLCCCRRVDDVISQTLRSRSTVVVGGPAGRWRASGAERWARRLTHLGHHVIFAPIDEGACRASGTAKAS